jgi:probable rRNA maturation factor
MTVEVVESEPIEADPDAVAAFAQAILEREGVEAEAHLTITFVSPHEIAELNDVHLGREGSTDVLSFPIEDAVPGQPPRREPDGPPLELGDIVIAGDVVADHAERFGEAFDDELYLMVCHGVLHILGWDHQTEDEANRMEAREATHLATIGRSRR